MIFNFNSDYGLTKSKNDMKCIICLWASKFSFENSIIQLQNIHFLGGRLGFF